MNNLNRQMTSTPKNSEQKKKLIDLVAQHIFSLLGQKKLFFFGSITGSSFDEHSDIDVVILSKTAQEAEQARRLLYQSPQPQIGHSIEYISTDEITFQKKSLVGGIFFIAKNEGIEFDTFFK